jgi:tRNA threonylcarbamoyladenosine biosynthesis protein TsaB
MIVLALDTALDHCQAAVVRLPDGAVEGASCAPAAGDTEAIVTHADAALAAAGVTFADLDRIAVTAGPGSFTGVRVGIACARGIAFALGIPAFGVATLEVMARQVDAPCVTVVDARHGAVFAALFPDATFRPARMARMPVEEALALAAEPATTVAGPPSAVAALGRGTVVERLDPVAIALAAGADHAASPPRALYLAAVDAAPQRHKALARA